MVNKDELLKINIERWIRSSEFLDKAILTLATSSIWFITFTDIKISQKYEYIFYFWVWFMLFTFSLVLIKYLIWINNLEESILKLQGWNTTKKNMNKIEKYIFKFEIKYIRYMYILTVIFGIIFLSFSLLV